MPERGRVRRRARCSRSCRSGRGRYPPIASPDCPVTRTVRCPDGLIRISCGGWPVSLALAIGANISVFSVVNTLLLRPLPFPESRELVRIGPPPDRVRSFLRHIFRRTSSTSSDAENRTYKDVTGYEAYTTPDNVRLTGRGEPQSATSIMVLANFFQVLGVQPAMGRLFTADELRGRTASGRLAYDRILATGVQRRSGDRGQGPWR